jgi:Peptide N-acetyl-beta-D-glucosaminyl asparaginase amidase A
LGKRREASVPTKNHEQARNQRRVTLYKVDLKSFGEKGDRGRDDPGRPADAVYPLMQSNGQGGFNEPAFLNTSTDLLATTLTLPRNIERAYLDVITQSQSNDEFWYSCVPNGRGWASAKLWRHRISRGRGQH